MPIQVVMFDLGGVVCRFDPTTRERALAAACGVPVEVIHERIYASGFDAECDRGAHDEGAVLERLREIGFTASLAELQQAWVTAFMPDVDVLELASRVRRTRRTALFTNNGPVLRTALPAQLSAVFDAFDHIVFSYELGATKPSAEAFLRAIDRCGAGASEVFFVDDSERNVMSAGELGIAGYHFTDAASLERALTSAGLI
jgi:glucose-1-phosphatase